MTAGINKVLLLGRVGKEPEVRTVGDKTVCSFTLATSERWKDKQSGEKKERTEWHRCVIWGRGAEVIAQYVRKGSSLYLEGQNRTRDYTDKQNVTRYVTEVVFTEFRLLGDPAPANGTHSSSSAPAPAPERAHAPAPAAAAVDTSGFEDDDIPF